jgi:uncharacterized membrane protein YhiD involved in acid resistance
VGTWRFGRLLHVVSVVGTLMMACIAQSIPAQQSNYDWQQQEIERKQRELEAKQREIEYKQQQMEAAIRQQQYQQQQQQFQQQMQENGQRIGNAINMIVRDVQNRRLEEQRQQQAQPVGTYGVSPPLPPANHHIRPGRVFLAIILSVAAGCAVVGIVCASSN